MTCTEFSPEATTAFAPDAKVGLIATRTPDDEPHITLITTLAVKDPTHLTWGQFSEGLSKRYVRDDPRVGFLVLTQERELWRGRARWTHAASEGEDFVAYNQRPMFRYNSYFGIHTVHYMDLVEVSDKAKLSLPWLLTGFTLAAGAGALSGPGRKLRHRSTNAGALNSWSRRLLARPDTIKFLGYIDSDGYPAIVPAVPTAASGSNQLVFVPTVYRDELCRLTPGSSVAVFALNLKMESVLCRGSFSGYRGVGAARFGAIDIEWVYNTMPPQQGQIYPPVPLESVTEF